MSTQKFKLPSGATLEVSESPFSIAKALYMVGCQEAKGLRLDEKAEVDVNFWKDLVCTGMASQTIEERIWECMKRATYNGLKITPDTFEPSDARQDYLAVCFEVAKVNVLPFTKSLFAQYAGILKGLTSTLASSAKKTTSS